MAQKNSLLGLDPICYWSQSIYLKNQWEVQYSDISVCVYVCVHVCCVFGERTRVEEIMCYVCAMLPKNIKKNSKLQKVKILSFFLPCLNFTFSMEPLKHAVHTSLYRPWVSKNCPILTQEVLILSMTDYFSQTQIKKPLKVILYSHRLLLLDLVDSRN